MLKILILAYDFPPYPSVGGVRPYHWFLNLKANGVFPIIVTRQWSASSNSKIDYISKSQFPYTIVEEKDNGIILRSPYFPNLANKIMLKFGEDKHVFIRRMITGLYEVMQYFFLFGTKAQLYFSANKYLKNNKVDLILATGDPYVLFRYALKLSKKNKIPCIIDYRDPWSITDKKNKNFFIRIIEVFLEKKYNNLADGILTVSEYVANLILVSNKKIHIISNGFNDFKFDVRSVKQNDKFLSFAISGTISMAYPIDSILTVFASFMKKHPDSKIRLNFIGINDEAKIKSKVLNVHTSLSKVVNFYPKMENESFVKLLAKQNVLILFNSYSSIGTKIYEYIALNRLILLCFSNDKYADNLFVMNNKLGQKELNVKRPQELVIQETESGFVIKDSSHLYEKIENLYEQYLINNHIVSNSKNIQKYSRKNQTKKLAEIIKSIVSEKQ